MSAIQSRNVSIAVPTLKSILGEKPVKAQDV